MEAGELRQDEERTPSDNVGNLQLFLLRSYRRLPGAVSNPANTRLRFRIVGKIPVSRFQSFGSDGKEVLLRVIADDLVSPHRTTRTHSSSFLAVAQTKSCGWNISTKSNFMVLSRYAPPGDPFSVNWCQENVQIKFNKHYAYTLVLDRFRVWLRGPANSWMIQKELVLFPKLSYIETWELVHESEFLVVLKISLNNTNDHFLFINMRQLIAEAQNETTSQSYLLTNFGFKGTLYCGLGANFFFGIHKNMTLLKFVEINTENFPRKIVPQASKIRQTKIRGNIQAVFSSCNRFQIFLAYSDELICWAYTKGALEMKAKMSLVDSKLSQNSGPNVKSTTTCSVFEPSFFESRGHLYLARILNAKHLEVYAFYKNRFIVVKNRSKTVHEPPAGYYWLTDTSGYRATLYAAKRPDNPTASFIVGRMILH